MTSRKALVFYVATAILLIALAFLHANFAGKNAARGGKRLKDVEKFLEYLQK